MGIRKDSRQSIKSINQEMRVEKEKIIVKMAAKTGDFHYTAEVFEKSVQYVRNIVEIYAELYKSLLKTQIKKDDELIDMAESIIAKGLKKISPLMDECTDLRTVATVVGILWDKKLKSRELDLRSQDLKPEKVYDDGLSKVIYKVENAEDYLED